jgi:hypothetical protein
MAISRLSASRLTQGLPKYQSAWDQDNVAQGAMVPIQTITATNAIDAFYFNNIPQIYQDLYIVFTGRTNTATSSNPIFLRLNNTLTGTSFSSTTVQGDGSSPTSTRETGQQFGMNIGTFPAASAGVGIHGLAIIHILDYKNTSRFKTVLTKTAANNNGSGVVRMNAGLWSNTAAVTALNVYGGGGGTDYFLQSGSTATVYGIKAGA